ncbi:MAG: ABC transporter ATP-binding protein, partial [Baekduiaceae bacterium]
MSAISITGLHKAFGAARAVDGVDLEVPEGEICARLGPAGCGKTTMLRLLAGFVAPDAGTIRVGERLVAGDGTMLAPEKRGIGMVFQDYALFPHLSVAENVGFGLPRGERSSRVDELLELVGLAGLGDRHPH